jgi:hypothetical protein
MQYVIVHEGQENICQHLNQYGHGNGTVHGGDTNIFPFTFYH